MMEPNIRTPTESRWLVETGGTYDVEHSGAAALNGIHVGAGRPGAVTIPGCGKEDAIVSGEWNDVADPAGHESNGSCANNR